MRSGSEFDKHQLYKLFVFRLINWVTVFLPAETWWVVKFIVLGFTQELSSRAIIGRYKSEEELKDIFLADRLSKAARRLYVFEVCRPAEVHSYLWIASFDVKLVKVRDPRRADGKALYKAQPHIYRFSKRLCSRICVAT